MKDSLANVQMLLPEEPVGVGAQWEVKQKVNSQGMNMDQTTTYTLAAVNGDILTIKGVVAQQAGKQKISNPTMPQVKMDVSKFSGSGRTSVTLDLAKVFPAQAEIEDHLEIGIGMAAPGAAGAQNGPQTMTMKVDLSIKLEGK
jgi:hypothetical protein